MRFTVAFIGVVAFGSLGALAAPPPPPPPPPPVTYSPPSITPTPTVSVPASTTTTTTYYPTTTIFGGAPHWGQCGGQGWSGPTVCQPPYTCVYLNDWHSQCL